MPDTGYRAYAVDVKLGSEEWCVEGPEWVVASFYGATAKHDAEAFAGLKNAGPMAILNNAAALGAAMREDKGQWTV